MEEVTEYCIQVHAQQHCVVETAILIAMHYAASPCCHALRVARTMREYMLIGTDGHHTFTHPFVVVVE